MYKELAIKFHRFLAEHSPEILHDLEDQGMVTSYVQDKVDEVKALAVLLKEEGTPAYVIEEACLSALKAEYLPSKFQYLREVLETEFEIEFNRMWELGTLKYELLNMLSETEGTFAEYNYSLDTEDSEELKNTIIGQVHEYLHP